MRSHSGAKSCVEVVTEPEWSNTCTKTLQFIVEFWIQTILEFLGKSGSRFFDISIVVLTECQLLRSALLKYLDTGQMLVCHCIKR